MIVYIASQLDSILPQLDPDGLQLFMLYIFPLFEHPASVFESIFVLFDPLAGYLGARTLRQVLLPCFLYAFDTFEKPSDNCRLLSRGMAQSLISHFGLKIFLSRFLTCIIEAVLEPLAKKVGTAKGKMDFLSTPGGSEQKHRQSLSRLSSSITHSLQPAGVAGPLSAIPWGDSPVNSSDDEDSDIEMNYPEASILVSNAPVTSMLAMLSDIEQSQDMMNTNASQQEGEGEGGGGGEGEGGRRGSDRGNGDLPVPPLPPPPHISIISTPSKSSPTLIKEQPLPTTADTSRGSLIMEHKEGPFSPIVPMVTDNSLIDDSLLPSSADDPVSPGLPLLLSNEPVDEREGEVMDTVEVMDEEDSQKSPQMLAISSHISEVASDCLIWLLWRLGPLLSTKYIIRPLLDNLHK